MQSTARPPIEGIKIIRGLGAAAVRFDNGIRRGRQEAVDEMRSGDRLGLGTALAFEFSPDAREGVLIGNSLSFRT